MGAKTSGLKFNKKLYIYIVSKTTLLNDQKKKIEQPISKMGKGLE